MAAHHCLAAHLPCAHQRVLPSSRPTCSSTTSQLCTTNTTTGSVRNRRHLDTGSAAFGSSPAGCRITSPSSTTVGRAWPACEASSAAVAVVILPLACMCAGCAACSCLSLHQPTRHLLGHQVPGTLAGDSAVLQASKVRTHACGCYALLPTCMCDVFDVDAGCQRLACGHKLVRLGHVQAQQHRLQWSQPHPWCSAAW